VPTLKGRCLNTGRTHFKKGFIPWNKGMKGIHLNPKNEFKPGQYCGIKHHAFNNGLSFFNGRWFIVCRDRKSVPFARALMMSELKRNLKCNEIVHHINNDCTDDRIENLKITTRREHAKIHGLKRSVKC